MNPLDRMELLLDLDPRQVAVLLVDFQKDFCGPAGLNNAHTAARANAFAGRASEFGVRTIYSRQVLDLDRLAERQRRWEHNSQLCLAGTPGAELFVQPIPGSRVVTKHRFDIWQSNPFLDVLTDWDIDGLIIGGVELQCCVLYAVLGADERGYHYIVPQDLASGLDACDQTSNRAVRDYLKLVHPSPRSSDELLAGWKARRSRREA